MYFKYVFQILVCDILPSTAYKYTAKIITLSVMGLFVLDAGIPACCRTFSTSSATLTPLTRSTSSPS